MLSVLKSLLGAGAIGVAGWGVGEIAFNEFLPWVLAFTLGGVVIGALAIPYVFFKPLGKALDSFSQIPITALMAATIGLMVGLIIAALISIPLFRLEGWLSWGVPLIISFSLGFLGLGLGAYWESGMRRAFPLSGAGALTSTFANGRIVVDTSAIIDGRIADLSQTGFLQGTLVIPGYVLDELRHIADSSDSLRRNRGRRGLEVLGRLRKDTSVPIQVLDVDVANGAEVDRQLVTLAKSLKASILTTDYNLNRVAELHGIRVLNINELANALKPILLPGEEITVTIIQEGKEIGQGVAFLDDGTMVVVEGGRRYLNSVQDVTVTRVLQTAAGRLIFAQPRAG